MGRLLIIAGLVMAGIGLLVSIGVPVGRLLVQLGFVSDATLRDALSEKLGMQSVDLAHIIVDPAALKAFPREHARR